MVDLSSGNLRLHWDAPIQLCKEAPTVVPRRIVMGSALAVVAGQWWRSGSEIE